MKLLFLHSWRSAPGGVKPKYLQVHGFEVINPPLDDHCFDLAIRRAQAEVDRHHPAVIVGNSRGGAVAMNIDSGDAKLVLLCPAWRKWGKAQATKEGTIILHSQADDIIPYEDSVALARVSDATLIEVGKDHRLTDPDSLSVLLWACKLAASGERLALDDDLDRPARNSANRKPTLQQEASYLCDFCGEEIVIPLDLTEGSTQSYVEDCPVCCRANLIHVQVDKNGNVFVDAEPEQDSDYSGGDREQGD